ncbi:MAG: hypothetical protein WCX16_02805 [Candidatus Omnitrophota bacterium]
MKNEWVLFSIFAVSIFCLGASVSYAQGAPCGVAAKQSAGADVNKDGVADVTYYSDGQQVTKAQADTNYDGKADITVHVEDGKFKSAEVDADYDGTPDKQFTNADEFKAWINANKPDFQESLGWSDWSTAPIKF